VLASQFTASIIQIYEPVSPASLGFSSAQVSQLGLQFQLTLTGWFTIDLLAAFALFVMTTVLAHARPVDEPADLYASSTGIWPSGPDPRRAASLPGL
jgi:hypothetical protein